MNKIIVFIICFFLSVSIVQNSYSMSGMFGTAAKKGVEKGAEKAGTSAFRFIANEIRYFFSEMFHSIPRITFYQLSKLTANKIKEIKQNNPIEYEEIKNWNAPSKLNDDEKVAYQLSCVVVIESQLGGGSGFYINEDTIISNHHVVEGKKQVNIKGFLKDNFINGNVIAYDKNLDLSAIKTSKGDHRPCNIEQSNSPPILSEVIAIGHPEGIEYRVTKGEISAYRDINKKFINDPNSIQVTLIDMSADIYFGSSGGPLFYKGNVIGVVVGGIKDANINFAIHFRKVNEFINKNRL